MATEEKNRLQAPMTFREFIDAAAEELKPVQARVVQRQESDAGENLWWFSFSRAACIYRVSFDRRSNTLTLERGQGSFVPNSHATWRQLESRHLADGSFETAVEVLRDLLKRFVH